MRWNVTTLGKLTIFGPQYGANASAVTASGERPRYIRITDIDSDGNLKLDSVVEANIDDESKFLLQDGDLLFARSGNTVGKTYFYTQKDGLCVFAGYLIRFRINPSLAIPKFVFYFTQSPTFQRWKISKRHVAGQPNINGSEYSALQIPLPPLSEQRRIVEILDEADRIRKLRREADQKAERILPALFLKMFGDPATNPKGWPTGTLGGFGAKVRYGLGQPPQASDPGLPLIRATNINAGRITTKDMLHVDGSDVPTSRNAFLSENEVIVVRSGAYTGDVAQVTEKWKGAIVGYDLVLTPPNGWTGEFVEQFLLTPYVQAGYFVCQKSRAGQPHLNSTQLESVPAYFAPSDLQKTFACQVRSIRKLCADSEQGVKQFDVLFDQLLFNAFYGQLTAKWREIHIKELLFEMEVQARLLNLSTSKLEGTLP